MDVFEQADSITLTLRKTLPKDTAGYAAGIVSRKEEYLKHAATDLKSHPIQKEQRLILDAIRTIIWYKDMSNHILFANQAAANFFGLRKEEIEGRSLYQLWPEKASQYYENDLKVIRTGKPLLGAYEYFPVSADKIAWIRLDRHPHRDADGGIIGIIVSAHDVTEVKQAFQEAERANHRKDLFLANMSHEFRTPLNAIIGFSNMLKNELPDTAVRQQKYAANISIAGQHMLNMVNDLLDIAKIEAGHTDIYQQSLKIAPLLEEIQSFFSGITAKNEIQLTYTVASGLEEVYADLSRLRQILYNLINNAIKFNQPGGAVSIRFFSSEDGQWVVCEVEDNGIGIPQEKQTQIFSQFYQVDNGPCRTQEGTGLGLALTRKLVELHHGTITLQSQEGTGTTFTFKLPAGACPQQKPQATDES